MSIFPTVSDGREGDRPSGAICACGCLLAWLAAGMALSAAESVFIAEGTALWFWRCVERAAQALAVLAAARALGLTRERCGLCRPQSAGWPAARAFAAAAAAFELLLPEAGVALPQNSGAAIAAALLELCVAAPIAEELTFRGAVQGALSGFGGAAVLIQAAAFALVHGTPAQKLYAFIMGLLLGELRRRTASVWPCCVLHGVNNMVVVVLSAAGV